MREFNTMTNLLRAHDDGSLAGAAARARGRAAATLLPATANGDKDKNGAGGGGGGGNKTGLVTKTRPKTKKPSLYKVLLLNDDYTPMEFVVHVLQKYFGKNREDAERIMLHVHQKGVGMCGVYTFEIAETKVTQVMDFSRSNNHPLQCTMEKE
ncbi:MAG: ATP-dependent Clp protease adapter ClpS [Hyphomicrobiaceae bacterium]